MWITANGSPLIDFRVALRPQRPYRLLGTGNPGRPPRLSHSSWALATLNDSGDLDHSATKDCMDNPRQQLASWLQHTCGLQCWPRTRNINSDEQIIKRVYCFNNNPTLERRWKWTFLCNHPHVWLNSSLCSGPMLPSKPTMISEPPPPLHPPPKKNKTNTHTHKKKTTTTTTTKLRYSPIVQQQLN